MSTAGRQLRMAAGAVDIRGPGSYVWRGEAINGPRDADVRGDGLVANLVQRLYERFYLTGARLHAPDVHARPQPWLCELPVTIARALREQRRLDRGWRPVGDENGQLVLERDGIRVWADPDEVVRGDDGICALRTAVDLPMRSFGFHTVLGVAGAPAMTGPRDRWYWHLRPDAAVAFVTDVCERLNAVDAAFHLKVLADPDIYGRADGGVLTTARADREVVVRATALLLRRFGAMLHPVVPALTLRLAPGLGFAEDPDDGRSFGATRCALVAGGLWDGFLAGAAGADERLEAVRARLALAGLDPDRPHLGPGGGDDPLLPAPHPKRRGARVTVEFPDVAAHIGRRLVDEARWDGGRCTWIAPHPDARERSGFVTRDLEPSWHAGTAGVAWFLAELWRAQGDAAVRRTAQGAMRQSVAGCRDIPVADRGGLFAGWAGIAVAAAAVGRLTGAPEFLETAAHLAEEFPVPRADDLVEGRAGALVALMALARDGVPDGGARIEALAASLRVPHEPIATDRQAGAAHGLAGVACALQAAGAYLDDPGLTLRAQGMRDRVAHLGPAGEVGWCRGAAGLAMCGLPDALWLEPLVRGAREHVAARHPDASLCHGLLGIADCMLTMARRRADLAHLRGLAEWVAEESARTLPCPGWPCGAGRETPGLLAGLAGIGLTYLRLADSTVPSPLEMSCPAAAPAITDTSARREPVEC